MPDMPSIWVTHFFLFLTTIAGFIYQWFREDRNHRWQVEEMKKLGKSVDRLQSYNDNNSNESV